jgi:hypothetical protein
LIQPLDEPHADLWRVAYTKLHEEKPSLVEDYENILAKDGKRDKLSPIGSEKLISGIVTQKLDEMKGNEWELKLRGKSVKVREQVERIVKIVQVFKDLGNSVAALDPIHAGLPWAGVCVLLSVSTDIFIPGPFAPLSSASVCQCLNFSLKERFFSLLLKILIYPAVFVVQGPFDIGTIVHLVAFNVFLLLTTDITAHLE